MTVPSVVSPSDPGDYSTVPPPTARDRNLQVVVERAQDQLRQLTLQLEHVAQRISIIRRTIHGLTLLYYEESQRRPEKAATSERRRRITNACRIVLNRADTPFTARGLYFILQGEF